MQQLFLLWVKNRAAHTGQGGSYRPSVVIDAVRVCSHACLFLLPERGSHDRIWGQQNAKREAETDPAHLTMQRTAAQPLTRRGWWNCNRKARLPAPLELHRM